MGISVKPSFKRHHGYRTRDRPPTRQAHRSDGLAACDPSQCRPRRPAPNKKPAAMDAAGFDHGRFLIRRRMRCRRPPFDDAGGGACRAADDRVVFYHSLLQETSAGRNLITVFSTVNNLSQKKIRARDTSAATASARCARQGVRDARAIRRMDHPHREKYRENECFLDAASARTHAPRTQPAAPERHSGTGRAETERCATKLRHRRALRVAQAGLREKCANFSAPIVLRGSRASGNEEPAAFPPRVPMHRSWPRGRVSGLRLPAVRRSRPGSATR